MGQSLSRLIEIESEMSDKSGPFNLFAFVESRTCMYGLQQDGWVVLVSAWWINSDQREKEVFDRIKASLDTDLSVIVLTVGFYHPKDENVWAFHAAGKTRHATRAINQGCVAVDNTFPSGGIVLPSGYVITSMPEPEQQRDIMDAHYGPSR